MDPSNSYVGVYTVLHDSPRVSPRYSPPMPVEVKHTCSSSSSFRPVFRKFSGKRSLRGASRQERKKSLSNSRTASSSHLHSPLYHQFQLRMLLHLSVVLLSEFSPPNFRTYSVLLFLLFWVLGSLFSSVVTYWLINRHGWEIVTFVVAIPHIVISIFVLLVDESPKYLAISGQIAAAEQVLNRMSSQNNPDFEIIGKLEMRVENNRGSLGDVVGEEYRKNFGLLSVSLGLVGIIVYSSNTMIPYMSESNHCSHFNTTIYQVEKCEVSAPIFKDLSYINVAEIVMLPIFAVVNEVFGRLKTLRLLSVILVVSTFFLVFCLERTLFMICLYVQRGSVQSLLLLLLIYTPECYPTHIRGAGCGLTTMFLFFGGLVSSAMVYPVGVLHGFSHLALALTLAAVGTLVTVGLMDKETRGCDIF
ncbi:hypothetical protein ACHWQZ_G013137 [Mnemiopsis leidyi]